MSSLPPPFIYDPAKHAHLLPQLAQIHADCVLEDGTLATILPRSDGTMDMAKLLRFAEARAAQVETGSRVIFIQMAGNASTGGGDGTAKGEEEEVAGHVSLNMPPSETGPFRSTVELLVVSPRHRHKGVARRIMGLLEAVAREKHRELLLLDTTIGSGAEHVYPRLGYTSYGIIPKYGIHPLTGELKDEMFFYKDLRG